MMTNGTPSVYFRRQNHLAGRAVYVEEGGAPGHPAASRDLEQELLQILARRDVSALFQPIVDLTNAGIYAFEGLIRGPSNSVLHSPLQLFLAADACGMRDAIERLARQTILEGFHQLNLPGRLFLNVGPECLLNGNSNTGRTLEDIRYHGIDPARVVIELTENQPTFDFDLMREAVRYYRQMGFSIAIDDLGQGFSSLRQWSELRPEYVKIDRHFVQGVDADDIKRQFLQAIQDLARSSNTTVIAEGIETQAEWAKVAGTGIALGQGYWFARPHARPAISLPTEVAAAMQMRRVFSVQYRSKKVPTAADLIRNVPTVDTRAKTQEVYELFNANLDLVSLPVLDGANPVGLISRHSLIDRYARPYRRELYGKKSCKFVMDEEPLLVDGGTNLHELSFRLAEAGQRYLADGFLVVEQGRYLGYGSGHDVVREMTRLQIDAARHTNPLTGLPGNIPINDCISDFLEQGADFFACYCDLDHFKPFNDVYGYLLGDELIRTLADTLRNQCCADTDFIGHIGGDDFMVLFRSGDWEARCDRILKEFAYAAERFFSPTDRDRGGYFTETRHGTREFVPLVSLSLGVVHVEAECYSAFHQVAAAAAVAKKEAKKIPGNSVFIERRQVQVLQEQLV